MAFVRNRYRQSAIQPELSAPTGTGVYNNKKIKEEATDPYKDVRIVKHEDPVFLPTHTQRKRVELSIRSDEEAYRMKVQPTIMERVELQRRWAAEQVHQAKVAKKRAAIKKLYEEQKDMARKQMLDEIDDVAANPNAADITKLADDATNLDADGMEDADDLFESEEDKSAFENMKDNDKDFGADMMELKERRLLNTRGTSIYHKLFTKYQKRVKALSIALQLHTVDRDVSEILPWLYISNKETASTISTLLKYNFTHILNVTHDVQSFFPHLFVYQRIPVKDSADSNMVDYFPKIVSFLQRVEKVQGRVLVHCTAGASRAPTAVMSFFVKAKKIPLADAYDLVCALRPLAQPNKRFLFHLSLLEMELGEGLSVLFHKQWRFFEFISYRNTVEVEARSRLYSYRAVWRMLAAPESDSLLG